MPSCCLAKRRTQQGSHGSGRPQTAVVGVAGSGHPAAVGLGSADGRADRGLVGVGVPAAIRKDAAAQAGVPSPGGRHLRRVPDRAPRRLPVVAAPAVRVGGAGRPLALRARPADEGPAARRAQDARVPPGRHDPGVPCGHGAVRDLRRACLHPGGQPAAVPAAVDHRSVGRDVPGDVARPRRERAVGARLRSPRRRRTRPGVHGVAVGRAGLRRRATGLLRPVRRHRPHRRHRAGPGAQRRLRGRAHRRRTADPRATRRHPGTAHGPDHR